MKTILLYHTLNLAMKNIQLIKNNKQKKNNKKLQFILLLRLELYLLLYTCDFDDEARCDKKNRWTSSKVNKNPHLIFECLKRDIFYRDIII